MFYYSGIPRGYSCHVVFPFHVYEETYTCLPVVCLRVVQQVASLESYFCRTSPCPITSHFMLFYFSSSSSSCTCSSFSNVLTLHVAIFSRSPLVWWFFLTDRFFAPPVCNLGGSEPPPRSQTSMLPGTGGFGLFVLCMRSSSLQCVNCSKLQL